VDLMLTEPSQVSEASPGESGELWLVHLRKPRRGQICFNFSCVLLAGSPGSTIAQSLPGRVPQVGP